MKKPTYERIRSLSDAIQRESRINSRRKSAKDLISFVSNDENRRRLSLEATPTNVAHGRSAAAVRCRALSQIWRVILHAATNFVQDIADSTKVKLTAEDLSVPFRLLVQCDKKDEAFDNPNFGIPRLSKQSARMMLNFCLDMLATDKAVEIAEPMLLDMLHHMCSRPLYIASFKYRTDLSNILLELKERLTLDIEKQYNNVFVLSAKAFDSLFSTCQILDIQIYHLLYDGIEIVSDWCKGHLKAQTVRSSVSVLPYFFNAVASMMLSCPEHAVAPITRHGRPLLSCAKQCYAAAVSINKDALNSYFYAHILVAEAAGRAQGMAAGDLGDLGKASLTNRQIMDMITMAIDDTPRIFSEISMQHQRSRLRDKRFKWKPLEQRQRQHLELCARLMSCAQRMYYSDILLNRNGGLGAKLLAACEEKEADARYPLREANIPTVNDMAKSPWVQLVVAPAYRVVLHQRSQGTAVEIHTQSEQSAQRTEAAKHPVLLFLSSDYSDEQQENDQSLASKILPTIGACAEIFLDGRCWASTAHWHQILLEDDLLATKQSHAIRSCDVEDLVLVLDLMSDILVSFGGTNRNVEVQCWTLAVLLRMTEATSAISHLFLTTSTGPHSIYRAWQRVWDTIFRPDLRYTSYTSVVSLNSVGELVLLLLTELVESGCVSPPGSPAPSPEVSPPFILERQNLVWKLPVFANHRSISVTAPFELMYVLTKRHPLSETGIDSIGATTTASDINAYIEGDEDDDGPIGEALQGRRYRLVFLVLARLDELLKECSKKKRVLRIDDRYASVLSACILSLVHGRKDAYLVTSFKFFDESFMAEKEEHDVTNHRLRFTNSRTARQYKSKDKSIEPNPLRCLSEPITFSDHLLFRSLASELPPPVWSPDFGQASLASIAKSKAPKDLEEAFMSETSSRGLRSILWRCLDAWIAKCTLMGLDASSRDLSLTATDDDQMHTETDNACPQSDSSWESLVLKISLSVLISCKADEIHDNLPELLEKLVGRLASGRASCSEFLTISTHVLQIARALTEVCLEGTHKISVSAAIISLQKACRQLLEGYANNGRQELKNESLSPAGKKPSSSQSHQISIHDEMMGDDFDEGGQGDLSESDDGSVGHSSNKRKPTSSPERMRKRPRLGPSATSYEIAAPSMECALRIASILLTLQPSLSNCQFICASLLGNSFISDADSEVVDMNYLSAMFCCEFLCSEEVLLFDSANGTEQPSQEIEEENHMINSGPIAMMCRIIEAIRSIEDPSSPLSAYGFRQLVTAIEIADGDLRKNPIQSYEARMIVHILRSSTGTKGKRAHQTTKVMYSALAFERGRRSFRQFFDREFVTDFIKPSFHSLYGSIRHAAEVATAAALGFLDEDKVINSISKLTAPLIVAEGEEGVLSTYSAWFERMEFLSTFEDDKNVKKTAALDMQVHMEADSISCKAMISSSQGEAMFLQSLFEIVKLCKDRPDLQFSCFLLLESVAMKRQYRKIETMMSMHSEALIQLWINDGYTLRDIPLLASGAFILRGIVESGNIAAIKSPKASESGLDLKILGEKACAIFIAKARHFVVPLLLIRAIQNPDAVDALDDPQFNDACDLLSDKDSIEVEEELRKQICYHQFQDIYSFAYVLLASESADNKQLAKSLLDCISTAIADHPTTEIVQKKSSDIVRGILELSGKQNLMIGYDLDETTFFTAICMFIENNCESSSSNGDVLFVTGTNLTASLIRARSQMDRGLLHIYQEKHWTTIRILVQFVLSQLRKGVHEYSQLGFCIYTLLDIILDTNFRQLRPSVFGLLRELLDESLGFLKEKAIKDEVVPYLERLACACYHVHEESQVNLVSFCLGRYEEYHYKLQRSTGLARLFGGVHRSDTWGWDTEEADDRSGIRQDMAVARFANRSPSNIRKVLLNTYEMFELVVGRSTSSILKRDAYAYHGPSCLSPSILKALELFDRKFAIQTLAEKFSEQSADAQLTLSQQIRAATRNIEIKLLDKQSWVSTPGLQNMCGGEESMNIDQQLLYTSLLRLENLLNRSKMSSVSSRMRNKDYISLLWSLSIIASTPSPRKLRITASCCLGELNIPTDEHLSMISQTSDDASAWLDQAILEERLILTLKARCITILARCLKSVSHIASVATDIIEVLFAKGEVDDCWDLISDRDCKILLRPFSQGKSMQRELSLELSENQITKIMKELGFVSPVNDDSWCWDKGIWHCTNSSFSSFEYWLSRLVPAIIVCCFKPNGKSKEKRGPLSQCKFLWLCQKLCPFEPVFCRALFPMIVLELLGKDPLTSELIYGTLEQNEDESFGKSGYNYLLSKAFTELMAEASTYYESDRVPIIVSKSLGLAVDTLDLLRRVSQRAFASSGEHQRNPISLANHPYNDQKMKKKWEEDPASYNHGVPPAQPWDGLPYGTIMRLDGLLVAKSCVVARRYAAALFFIELFLNSILGGCGDILRHNAKSDLGKDFVPTLDISGLSRLTNLPSEASLDCENVEPLVMSAISLLRHCYYHLREDESMDALSASVPLFQGPMATKIEATLPPLESLQKMDVMSMLYPGQISTEALRIAQHLEDLHLKQLLQFFIQGLTFQSGIQTTEKQDESFLLKEKWYQNCVSSHRWRDMFLDGPKKETGLTNLGAFAKEKSIGRFPPNVNGRKGFFESLHSFLISFSQDNSVACAIHVENSRWQILDTMINLGDEEHLSANIMSTMDALHAVSDLNFAAKSESFIDVLKHWDLPASSTREEHPLLAEYRSDISFGLEKNPGYLTLKIRENLLDILRAKHRDNSEGYRLLDSGLMLSLWNSGQIAQREGMLASADASLSRLASMVEQAAPDSSVFAPLIRVKVEEAKIIEKRGEISGAIRKLDQVISFVQSKKIQDDMQQGLDELLADAQVICGMWMTDHKMQQAKIVLDSYLRPGERSSRLIFDNKKSSANARRCTTASIALAQLVAGLYDSLSLRTSSLEWKAAEDALRDQEEELQRCEPLAVDARKRYFKHKGRGNTKEMNTAYNELHDIEIYRATLGKDTKRTRLERESVEDSVKEFLNTAIQSFATALELADTGSPDNLSRHVFRMVSLWFSGYESQLLDEETSKMLSKIGERIPSFRFVPLINQIFSRIDTVEGTDSNGNFQLSLQQLVYKICESHPYHALVQLIALANGRKVGSGVSGRNATAFLENISSGKVDAAETVMKRLKKSAAPYIGKLLDSYTLLVDAYIRLANTSTQAIQKTKTKNIAFSEVCSSPKLSLDQCLGGRRSRVECPPCVLTNPPTLRPGCDYGEGKVDPIGSERVLGFDPHFSISETGIHRPKIVICLGSRGGRYRQLAKGEDEIRQDAVMSQVFTYVNGLVSRGDRIRTKSTNQTSVRNRSKRRLKVVTYNIVPLSPASGILEWVEDTMPFGDYLVDKRIAKNKYIIGAHSKYYPDEWGNLLCRLHLSNSPPSEKRKSFDEVCVHHSPVFRFFFVERFGHSLQAWYTARMKYITSVAVTSIVGHILGIGDRHSSNILVHQKTGEVVHIDFGIVFDQGKLLNTPERVPFRLTRNMVDAMGPTGTEGIFTRVAEETLHLLKENADALLTILSAIVSDPLYKFNISPVKAQRRQAAKDEDAEERYTIDKNESKTISEDKSQNASHNEAGSKAIGKVKEKLQGYEDGTSGEQQSVEGQVQLLVNSATDRDNLCQMYPGWSPWM